MGGVYKTCECTCSCTTRIFFPRENEVPNKVICSQCSNGEHVIDS